MVSAAELRQYIRVLPFLRPDHCADLVEQSIGSPHWRPARIMNRLGNSVAAEYRTCSVLHASESFLRPIIDACSQRVRDLTSASASPELVDFQFVRYTVGQRFDAHRDSIHGYPHGRKLSVVVYLNDGFEGGRTEFPEADVAIEPVAGHALIFPSAMLHRGEPVTAGTKYALVFWLQHV